MRKFSLFGILLFSDNANGLKPANLIRKLVHQDPSDCDCVLSSDRAPPSDDCDCVNSAKRSIKMNRKDPEEEDDESDDEEDVDLHHHGSEEDAVHLEGSEPVDKGAHGSEPEAVAHGPEDDAVHLESSDPAEKVFHGSDSEGSVVKRDAYGAEPKGPAVEMHGSEPEATAHGPEEDAVQLGDSETVETDFHASEPEGSAPKRSFMKHSREHAKKHASPPSGNGDKYGSDDKSAGSSFMKHPEEEEHENELIHHEYGSDEVDTHDSEQDATEH